jgi:hypothetical protein
LLYFSPYHPRRSVLLPKGLTQADWPEDEDGQIRMRVGGFGVTSRVEWFPNDLPSALRGDPSLLLSLADGPFMFGHLLARILESIKPNTSVMGLPRPPLPPGIDPASLAPMG